MISILLLRALGSYRVLLRGILLNSLTRESLSITEYDETLKVLSSVVVEVYRPEVVRSVGSSFPFAADFLSIVVVFAEIFLLLVTRDREREQSSCLCSKLALRTYCCEPE